MKKPTLDEWPDGVERVMSLSRSGEREAPALHFPKVARAWSGILNAPVSAEQVCLCLVALKAQREAFRHHPDNLTDIVGYVECLRQVQQTKGQTKA